MVKGKRVYLDDLVEEYIGMDRKYPMYASFHNGTLMNGPFTVIAAGKKRIAVRNIDGRRDYHFTGDIGLVPYDGIKWNETNATFEILPEPEWADDWM
jgi:hypothetical protein